MSAFASARKRVGHKEAVRHDLLSTLSYVTCFPSQLRRETSDISDYTMMKVNSNTNRQTGRPRRGESASSPPR